MAASSPAAALAQALLTIGALWAGGELWRRGADSFQLRIESDLFIARDPPSEDVTSADPARQPPVPPEVYLGSPLRNPTLEVMAIKVRTGVTWTTGRIIPVTAGSKP